MTTDETTPDAADIPEINNGRYLYCVVQAESDAELETTGIDGESVSVIAENGIGAVVHACDGLYDTDDLGQIQRWLIRHQTVVDAAGEAFGTPVPFQFDTILRGGEAGLRQWLREETDTLQPVLSELAGHWEYRVEVVEYDSPDDETLIAQDERLSELEAQIDEASKGQAFLLEKQFDQRLTELRAARRETMTAELEAELAKEAREVHTLERSPASEITKVAGRGSGGSSRESDGGDGGDNHRPGGDGDTEDESNATTADSETICRLTLLAHEDNEDEIGSILDDVAAEDGIEVRFTGPWPPYTFAPAIGDDENDGNGNGDGDGGNAGGPARIGG
ncbi:gas vesicle synthesis protein GvpLGvpF [Natrialba chahannaoensis JCM 10990]|uniref:Gas vesicle synthesis protein GvpLGvpF n=1 Tax=Natrialba chahannaoensis JCM 10990 TaxID=1227492 RepID=M0AFU2_9EURY|nr:GvpL/GvpF family gas vesicle protein [Natrialba chahannaoensis]ELY97595.1 gas vesicle synthesis protein GvpLGvpF [Natrialba chahannaoensis JCM 10990]